MLGEEEGDEGDRQIHPRQAGRRQPGQEQRVAARLEQRVPRHEAEEREERPRRVRPLARLEPAGQPQEPARRPQPTRGPPARVRLPPS